jgi:carboxymethylenebutenolidase
MAATTEQLTLDESPMEVYKATPVAGTLARGNTPGMIVIHARSGIDPFSKIVCDRLAEEGYTAVCPNLFHRQPPAPQYDTGSLRDEEVERDVRATIAMLRQGEVGDAPIGIVGFCMGGRVSYLMPARIPELAAAAVFYGSEIRKGRHGNPSPLEQSASIQCPILGFFGKDDQNPSQEDVAAISAELTRLGKPHTFHSYDNAAHTFMNYVSEKGYRQEAAIDAWPKFLTFIRQALKERVAAPVG